MSSGTSEPNLWSAPLADGPVHGVLSVPGSKSHTNRALVLAALAATPSRLRAPLRSRDTLLMAAGVRALGVRVDDATAQLDDGHDENRADADWLVTPAPLRGGRDVAIDCGNAGTVARFLPPVAALASGSVAFDGDPRMRERPLSPLLAALRTLGVTIDDGGRGAFPLAVHGTGAVSGGSVTVNASSSSQLVSGLLLAAPRFTHGIELRHSGPPYPSTPHVRMTVTELRAFGADVDDSTPDVWRVAPGELRGRDLTVEPDLSSASAFLAAAAATAGVVTVRDWPTTSEQPGMLLPELLEAFGCRCEQVAEGLRVAGPDSLRGADLDLHAYGEAAPTLTALAVLARTPSRLRGIAHLRLQETDRLAALAQELGKLGARIEVTDDGLAVAPAPLHGGDLDPHADHRLAMAFAVVGLVVPGVRVADIATTGKTVPEFPRRWSDLVRPAARHEVAAGFAPPAA